MGCQKCECDLERTIAFDTICCQKSICAECLLPRTGRCNKTDCSEIHFKCYFCDKVSNIPRHIISFIALVRDQSRF